MVLALARYLAQEPVATKGLLVRVAREAPDALVRAVRYSGLVLKQYSPRRTELDQAAASSPAIAELCRVLDILDAAYRERVAAVEMHRTRLADLSAFELLLCASLHAYQHLIPRDLKTAPPANFDHFGVQLAWDAISDLLAWKLAGGIWE